MCEVSLNPIHPDPRVRIHLQGAQGTLLPTSSDPTGQVGRLALKPSLSLSSRTRDTATSHPREVDHRQGSDLPHVLKLGLCFIVSIDGVGFVLLYFKSFLF